MPSALRKKEIILIIALLLIATYAVIYYSFPQIHEQVDKFNNSLESLAKNQGYAGALLVSFIGSLSIIVVIPYPAFVFLLATLGLNIWALSLLAGLGAALGEVTAYLLGFFGARLAGEKHAARFNRLNQWFSEKPRLIPLLIFIFALTPLPDDLLFVPLGLVKYSFKKALLWGFLGKLCMLLAMTYFGKRSLDILGFQDASFISQILTLALTALIVYSILKINWDKLLTRKND